MTRDDLLLAFETRVAHPASARELVQLLKIPRDARVTVNRLLKTLVADGTLVLVRGHRYARPGTFDLIVGKLQRHPDGYGFVVPEQRADQNGGDIYVAAENLQDAMHGDRVTARIQRESSARRREGTVIRVLERGNERVVGRLELSRGGHARVVPHERRVGQDIQVLPADVGEARHQDMVVVETMRWPTATRPPLGRVTEVLGPLDRQGVDTQVIIRKHNITDAHSDLAVAEATRLGADVRGRDVEGRTDFRAWPTVTIDGEHARDFDDAITLELLPNGHYGLGVHIADVAHYVRPGSALDQEAYERGTSVYFPERAVHMFPAELSTGLCSLNPNVDRLVQSCVMEVNAQGDVVSYQLHDGVITSDARMTYTAVNAILTDRDPAVMVQYAPLVPLFERMRVLFDILLGRRRRRGSIDFDLPQAELTLDDEGLVAEITRAERNVAHRIIEEFMLLANETVAHHLDIQAAPALYRVHEPPDPFKVSEFEMFLSSLGHSLSATAGGVRPRDFQRLIDRVAGTPVERPIAFLMLRTMQQARYDPANLGHFGLAAPCYTHFTSPIRRYPDLVVHRLLREVRRGAIAADRREELSEQLPETARHTSGRERRAMDAERELVQWKKVRFMAGKVGDEFDAYVTGVSAFGMFVELVEPFVEGLVHVSTMADDYYRYLESEHVLKGEQTGRMFRLGDRVRVQVLRVDTERRMIDLGIVDLLENVRAERSGLRRRAARAKSDRRSPAPRQRRRTSPPRRRRRS